MLTTKTQNSGLLLTSAPFNMVNIDHPMATAKGTDAPHGLSAKNQVSVDNLFVQQKAALHLDSLQNPTETVCHSGNQELADTEAIKQKSPMFGSELLIDSSSPSESFVPASLEHSTDSVGVDVSSRRLEHILNPLTPVSGLQTSAVSQSPLKRQRKPSQKLLDSIKGRSSSKKNLKPKRSKQPFKRAKHQASLSLVPAVELPRGSSAETNEYFVLELPGIG